MINFTEIDFWGKLEELEKKVFSKLLENPKKIIGGALKTTYLRFFQSFKKEQF